MKNISKKMSAAFKDKFPIYFLAFFLILFFLGLYMADLFVFTPKIVLLLFIVLISVYLGKLRYLYKDWFVFIAMLYLFDSMRGTIYILTCKLNLPVHTLYVIKLEKLLFGKIPANEVQKAILNPDHFTWFERVLTVNHGTHFITFLFIGLFIWLYKSQHFNAYKISFYLLTIIGVSFYFIIPTVPPWMAANVFHLIPELTHFNIDLYNLAIPDVTSGFATNPIAAMPSLHTAFPVLCSLILWRIYRWKSLPFHLYTAIMLFTIVYTGDHYIVDLLAGALLAGFSFILAFKMLPVDPMTANQEGAHAPLEKPPFFRKYRSLFIGTVLLTVGITFGLENKRQFITYPDKYNYTFAPNYIDFNKHPEHYENNFYIQIYFGDRSNLRGDHEEALGNFQRALEISTDMAQIKKAEFKIDQTNAFIRASESGSGKE